MPLVFALAAAGAGIQWWWGSVWPGLPLIIIASLFLYLRGTNNEPSKEGAADWQNVTPQELQRAWALLSKCRGFSSGAFTAFSCSGCAALFGVTAVFLVGFLLLSTVRLHGIFDANLSHVGSWPEAIVVADALLLLVFPWFSGRVSAWQPPDFAIKLEAIVRASDYVTKQGMPELSVQPSMEVQKTNGTSVPRDARLLVKFKDAPEDFMGVQVQVSINRVQGTAYPYLYCVILARPAFGLAEKVQQQLAPPGEHRKKRADADRWQGETVELQPSADVEVAVVRQFTTKQSGYHTNPTQQIRVLGHALNLARTVLGRTLAWDETR